MHLRNDTFFPVYPESNHQMQINIIDHNVLQIFCPNLVIPCLCQTRLYPESNSTDVSFDAQVCCV